MPEYHIEAHSEKDVISILSERKPLLGKVYSEITIKVNGVIRIRFNFGGSIEVFEENGILEGVW